MEIVKRPPSTQDELYDGSKVAKVQARFLLTAQGGVRIRKAVALRWDDLHTTAQRLIVTSGQGRKSALPPQSLKNLR